MSFNTKLNYPVSQIIKNSGINNNTALFAANQARKFMHDYVPMKTGELCNKVQVFAENNRGSVVYTQPYASFCYYGDRKNFNRDKHEKASAYWDKAMILTRKDDLISSVNNYIKNISNKGKGR